MLDCDNPRIESDAINKKTPIYIVLTDSGTMLSRTIKHYTQAPYNHVSISFDEELTDMYSFGRKKPLNPLVAGFVKEDVCDGTYSYFPETTCAIYRYEVSVRTASKLKRIIRTFEENKEFYTYNLLGLFGVPLKVPISNGYSYFCSQFVAEVLKRAGLGLWEKPSALVTPEDFRDLKEFELIYEGQLNRYKPIILRSSLLYRERNKSRLVIADDLLKEQPIGYRLFELTHKSLKKDDFSISPFNTVFQYALSLKRYTHAPFTLIHRTQKFYQVVDKWRKK